MNHYRVSRRNFLQMAGLWATGVPLGLSVPLSSGSAWTQSQNELPLFSTFSIVAFNPGTNAWGVAITSRVLGVGKVCIAQAVLDAIADIDSTDGTILSQLRIMVRQAGGGEVQTSRDIRQIGVVDAEGNVAAHTGSACIPWAGHLVGDGFCCQGNTLTGEAVLDAVAETFTTTSGDFADRLLAAIKAGDAAGGDSSGLAGLS